MYKVLQHIGNDLYEKKLDSYHCLNKKKQSGFTEISRSEDCKQVIRVKKDLKDLNPTDLDSPEETPCVPITEYFGTNEK